MSTLIKLLTRSFYLDPASPQRDPLIIEKRVSGFTHSSKIGACQGGNNTAYHHIPLHSYLTCGACVKCQCLTISAVKRLANFPLKQQLLQTS